MRLTALLALFTLLITNNLIKAQSYEFQGPVTSCDSCPSILLKGLDGPVKFVDLNADGNMDIIGAGENYEGTQLFISYLNTGNGGFELFQQDTFEVSRFNRDLPTADLDGDGFPEVLVVYKEPISQNDFLAILRNDGAGNLSLDTAGLSQAGYSGKFVDYNNDGDIDIVAWRRQSVFDALLFLQNNGSGVFSVDANTGIVDSIHHFAFGDIDGDNDQDIFAITRIPDPNRSFNKVKIYSNNGSGHFSGAVNNTFQSTPWNNLTHLKDIDGDGDLDVSMGGSLSSKMYNQFLYQNDGSGQFTEVLNHGIIPISIGVNKFIDVDGDSDMDLIYSVVDSSSTYNNSISSLNAEAGVYLNNGNFSFSKQYKFENIAQNGPSPFFYLTDPNFDAADANNDGFKDILISYMHHDRDQMRDPFSMDVYWHSATSQLNFERKSLFPGLYFGDLYLEDIDSDGDKDVIVNGRFVEGRDSAQIYFNDGLGNFTASFQTTFIKESGSSMALGDVDGDGDFDIYKQGYNDSLPQERPGLYINNGSGVFTLDTTQNFKAWSGGEALLVDIDTDGDLDILSHGTLVPGYGGLATDMSLYLNDGGGSFSIAASNLSYGRDPRVFHADLDNDGDEDFVINSKNGFNSTHNTYIHLNQGNSFFNQKADVNALSYNTAHIAFKDIDKDGDLDIIKVDNSFLNNNTVTLFENDGQANFTHLTNKDWGDFKYVSAFEFFDIDLDGQEELLVTGELGGNHLHYFSAIYNFDTAFNFTLAQDSFPLAFSRGAAAIGDIDGDGDEDMLISGFTEFNRRTLMYRNKARSGIGVAESPLVDNSFFKVYPNPNKGTFRIETLSDDPKYFEVYNLQGQLLCKIKSANNELHQLNLLPGLYIISNHKKGQVQSRKIWVQE
jgi:hypothetical protein